MTGAGGVSVAIGELARWTEVTLDNVPRSTMGWMELNSTSLKRMAVVVAASDADKSKKLAESENLEGDDSNAHEKRTRLAVC